MSHTEPTSLSRAQQKIQNRARIRARPATPEDQLEHLDKLLEEQQELQDMLMTPLPSGGDQGEESGYDPDPEDCDQEQDTDVYTDMESLKLKIEIPKERSAQPQPENRPRHVTFADQVDIEPSYPPPPPPPALLPSLSPQPSLEEPLPPPILPPRTCSHLNNKNNNNNSYPRPGSVLPQALRAGKCTPPKTFGQGYDPPFVYPEFIAKNQQSRVNYILTLVDSLVLQMERFGPLTLKSEEEIAGGSSKTSTGAIPKVRLAKSEFRGVPKGNRERAGSRPRSQAKGKPLKKTYVEQEVEYDMDYEFCMDQIEEFRANRIRACGACVAGRTLDVIRGHLSRADYSDASKLPKPKRLNNGRDSSSSSSGTATLTPTTRPCSPEGQRQPNNRPARDLEQLLDPTTDWPANKKKESKQQRSTLENLFNMTPASPPTRITIVAGKRQHQKGTGGGGGGGGDGVGAGTGASVTYPAHRSKSRETTLIPCMKKRNR